MTIFGAGGSAFPPPEWVARNGAWLDSLTVARDPDSGSDPGSADGTAGKVYTFDNMTAESAARQLDRIRRQQDLKAQARDIVTIADTFDNPPPPTPRVQLPLPVFTGHGWQLPESNTPPPLKFIVDPQAFTPLDGNGNRIPQPGVEPNPSYDELHNPPTSPTPSTNTPTPQAPTTPGPDLGPRPLEIGVGPDEQPQVVLPVQGPDGISRIELGPDGTSWVIDPDGTRTPVNSYGIAPPRRTHANHMFDPYTGRWITPPENPTGLAPENRSPFREAITSALSPQPDDPTSLNPPQSPDITVHADGSMEVRLPRGGSDGADRPWTDVRIINADGRETAHYREGIDGNRHYPLGAGHSVTITPDGKVLDPPHVDRSPLYSLTAPDGHNRIGYIEPDGWTTALEPIPLPPGVPGQTLYTHAGRLIIRDTNGEYHWTDATPETPTPTPAQRSIDLPWDGGDTNSYQAPDGTWYYNVNGHKVAFTPDRQHVITPANGLRPTGTGGIYQDDRPGYGPASGNLLRAAFPIPSKQIPLPEGLPAVALFELEDGRLVIVDNSGGNHYVSPLPAPPPEGWQTGLIHAFMNVATAYGGRRGGWANPERPPLGGGPTTRSSTLEELNTTFGRPPGRQTQPEQTPYHVERMPPTRPARALPDQFHFRTRNLEATMEQIFEVAVAFLSPQLAVPGGGRFATAAVTGGGGGGTSRRINPSGRPRDHRNLDKAAGVPLTADNIRALEDYTGAKVPGGFREINGYLRDPSSPKWTNADRVDLQARADAVSEALRRLPNAPGTTYRGVGYDDAILARYAEGSIVTEAGFTSTTRNPKVADGSFEGNVLMIITGRNGRDVVPYAGRFEYQRETLYDKGTRFKVIFSRWDDRIRKWKIVMEEVDG